MLAPLTRLDRRAQRQAVAFSVIAQALGLALVAVLASGQASAASAGQMALALGYTLLSCGMSLHVAARLQLARQAHV